MLDKRVRRHSRQYMERLFLNRREVGSVDVRIDQIAGRHGIRNLEVVKTRRDGKVIARGVHARWGCVALKCIDPIGNPAGAYQSLHNDGLVASKPSGIFPSIHHIEPGHSISEWVQGETLKQMVPELTSRNSLIPFVDALAEWTKLPERRMLTREEILSIVRFYIEVTVRRMNYRSPRNCVAACVRFARREQPLAGHIGHLIELAAAVRIPYTRMLADLHPGNLIYSPPQDRLVYIDLESIRPGSHVFDAVFLLSYLLIERSDPQVAEQLARHLFTPSFMGDGGNLEFFRHFAAYVTAAYMTIDGHEARVVADSLAVLPGG